MRHGRKIQQPSRRCGGIARGCVRGVQQSVRAVVAIVTKIGADDGVGVGLELVKQVARSKLIAGASKVSPETFREVRAVELRGEHRERLLPLGQRGCTIALLVVGDGETVIHIRPVGREFERVIVVGDGVLRVAGAGIVVGQGQVSGGARRTLLENGGQEIFRVAQFCSPKVFAITRAIVEPGIARELLGAIDWPGETHADGVVAEGGEERVVHVRRRLGEIEPHERVVGFVPDGRARLAASLHDGVGQRRAAVRDHIVRGLLTRTTSARPMRCAPDPAAAAPAATGSTAAAWRRRDRSCEKTRESTRSSFWFVAGRTVGIGGRKQRRAPHASQALSRQTVPSAGQAPRSGRAAAAGR